MFFHHMNFIINATTLDSGIEAKSMGMASYTFQMVVHILVNLTMVRPKAKEGFFIITVIFTMDSGQMTNLMVMESMYLLMGVYTKGSGKMIKEMGRENNLGQMVLLFKEHITKTKNKEGESSYGLMEVNMWGNLGTISKMDKA